MKMREALSVDALRSIYGRVARRYDAQHGFLTAYSDGRGRELVVRATVRAGEGVLDCGAGTGSTGLLAARAVGPTGHVTLFDLAPEMLAVAEQKAKAQGVRDRIELQTGDLVHLPFADGSFDVVLFAESIGHLDLASAFREAARVLKRRGRLMATSYTEAVETHAAYARHRLEEIEGALATAGLGVAKRRFLDAKRSAVTERRAAAKSTVIYVLARKPALRARSSAAGSRG